MKADMQLYVGTQFYVFSCSVSEILPIFHIEIKFFFYSTSLPSGISMIALEQVGSEDLDLT